MFSITTIVIILSTSAEYHSSTVHRILGVVLTGATLEDKH